MMRDISNTEGCPFCCSLEAFVSSFGGWRWSSSGRELSCIVDMGFCVLVTITAADVAF